MKLSNSLGLSSVRSASLASSYIPQAIAFFNAMSVEPSGAEKTVYNYGIKTYLVDTGDWDLLDWLYVPYALNSADSKIELINPSVTTYYLNPQNFGANFTARSGWQGAATRYFKTAWNDSLATKATRNSNSFGCFVESNVSTGKSIIGASDLVGVSQSLLYSNIAGSMQAWANQTVAGVTAAIDTAGGLISVKRINSTTIELFQRGVSLGTFASASQAFVSDEWYIAAWNLAGVAPIDHYLGIIQCAFRGSSAVNHLNIQNFVAYLKANL